MSGQVVIWMAAHMASSASMLVVNKAAVASFPPCSLIIYQALITLGVLFLQSWKTIQFSRSLLIRWSPVAFLFVSMLTTSVFALERIPIETLIVFRNLTALGVAAGDFVFFRRRTSRMSLASIVLMIVGALQYGAWDVHFDKGGYIWAIANTCATACYNILVKQTIHSLKMKTESSTFYNNLLCLPFLFGGAVLGGETTRVVTSFAALNVTGFLVLFLSGFVGFAISYAGFKLQSLISATSFTVVVNVSKIVSIIAGMILFRTIPTIQAALGLALSLIGGWTYAFSNMPDSSKDKKKEK